MRGLLSGGRGGDQSIKKKRHELEGVAGMGGCCEEAGLGVDSGFV